METSFYLQKFYRHQHKDIKILKCCLHWFMIWTFKFDTMVRCTVVEKGHIYFRYHHRTWVEWGRYMTNRNNSPIPNTSTRRFKPFFCPYKTWYWIFSFIFHPTFRRKGHIKIDFRSIYPTSCFIQIQHNPSWLIYRSQSILILKKCCV